MDDDLRKVLVPKLDKLDMMAETVTKVATKLDLLFVETAGIKQGFAGCQARCDNRTTDLHTKTNIIRETTAVHTQQISDIREDAKDAKEIAQKKAATWPHWASAGISLISLVIMIILLVHFRALHIPIP